ncbi:FAD-dependent oxidoreductase [Synechococcus sp. M16CYN]|uniref:FAD-dependent oxidoreductase n=1 Tax=Synechococcus sp. M16CYN TaxID=3103139 RepID=UPI00324C8A88
MIRSEVLVWGGGTGGVAAALQAARSGSHTILFTPGLWLGGMVSAAGVCAPDGHELSCWQTGLWGAFLRELQRCEPSGLDHNWASCFGYRPQLAEQIFQRWVKAEPLLQWYDNCELVNLVCLDGQIQRLNIRRRSSTQQFEVNSYEANVFIDGSDLGDLLAHTQIPYRWGWEPQERWNEPSAPPQHRLKNDLFFEQQPIQSPTWVVMGQLNTALGPPQDAVPPLGLFNNSLTRFGLKRTITYGRLPGGLVMLNWPLDGNDWHHGLQRAISSNLTDREALASEMRDHSRAFLRALQTCSDGWLSPGTAFPSRTSSLAFMPYWRESRRLIGRTTVTEGDILPITRNARRGPLPLNDYGRCTSIAFGTYANDHHYPGEDWFPATKSCLWGGRWTGTPFCIPYDALVSEAVTNLLMADKGVSVSHVANGATRLQPLIINIGQAAGMAAALSVRFAYQPLDLPVDLLQFHLLRDRVAPAAVLPLWQWPSWHPHWREAQEHALNDPDRIDEMGLLNRSCSDELTLPTLNSAPSDSKEEVMNGTLRTTQDGHYELTTKQACWTVITLEPAVHYWLTNRDWTNQIVRVRVVRNPWGPWLRLIGVLDQLS